MTEIDDFYDGQVFTASDVNAISDKAQLVLEHSATNSMKILVLEANAALADTGWDTAVADMFIDSDGYNNTVNIAGTNARYVSASKYYDNWMYYPGITGFSNQWLSDSDSISFSPGGSFSYTNHSFGNSGSDGGMGLGDSFNYGAGVENLANYNGTRQFSFDNAKRFTIDQLPLVVNINAFELSFDFPLTSPPATSQIGKWYFEKVDANTIRYKKDAGAWTNIDVTTWTKTTLEFRGSETMNYGWNRTGGGATSSNTGSASMQFWIGDGTNWYSLFNQSITAYGLGQFSAQGRLTLGINYIGRATDGNYVKTNQLATTASTIKKVFLKYDENTPTNTNVKFDYSHDGGTTWLTSQNQNELIDVPLANEGTQPMLRLKLNTTDPSVSPYIKGFVFMYWL